MCEDSQLQGKFLPHCLPKWHKLDPEIRLSPSISSFRNKLLSLIYPPAKPVFSVHDPNSLAILTQLRVGLSHRVNRTRALTG